MRFSVNLADAMGQYLVTLPSHRLAAVDWDLLRFSRWYGHERPVESLTPPEVARYAGEVLMTGNEIQDHLTVVKAFLGFLKRKGLSKHSLAPHVKLPRAARAVAAHNGAEIAAISMTAAGHQALQQELQGLKDQRGEMAEAIRRAAADKDFSENAPLDAAREAQGKMEARVRELEETLRRAVVIDGSGSGATDTVQVGSAVALEDVASGREVRYILVDSAEADPVAGKLSVASPVGRALVGHHIGDEVEVTAPKGLLRYRIASVGR
jgi:transcription elongation factor GreA